MSEVYMWCPFENGSEVCQRFVKIEIGALIRAIKSGTIKNGDEDQIHYLHEKSSHRFGPDYVVFDHDDYTKHKAMIEQIEGMKRLILEFSTLMKYEPTKEQLYNMLTRMINTMGKEEVKR